MTVEGGISKRTRVPNGVLLTRELAVSTWRVATLSCSLYTATAERAAKCGWRKCERTTVGADMELAERAEPYARARRTACSTGRAKEVARGGWKPLRPRKMSGKTLLGASGTAEGW